jgi:hypothetical protein
VNLGGFDELDFDEFSNNQYEDDDESEDVVGNMIML